MLAQPGIFQEGGLQVMLFPSGVNKQKYWTSNIPRESRLWVLWIAKSIVHEEPTVNGDMQFDEWA